MQAAKRIFSWTAGPLGGAVILVVLGLLALDTQPGRKLVLNQLTGIAPDSGLRIDASRIDGSVYGRLTIRDLRLRDPDGVFLTSPAVMLDWTPSAFIFGDRLEIAELDAASGTLIRLPRLVPSAEPRPMLPEFDIDIERLR
ncbi:MAG: hypothetical protein WA979_01375, partial [Pacificimonas sp.]